MSASAQINLDFIESTQPPNLPPPTYGLNHVSNEGKTGIYQSSASKAAEATGGSVDDYEGQVKSAEEKWSSEGVIDGDYEFGESPTEEEEKTLRKVPAPMPWPAIAMCLVEFAERASYYGCSGVFANFITRGLPDGGNGAGAVAPGKAGELQSAGALGLGLQVSTALTTLFTFLAYLIPVYGGIVADTRWGRFKTICVGTFVGFVAHVILVIPAIPKVIASGHALAPFILAIIILAFASGFIKSSLGPLLCDQSPVKRAIIRTEASGERVIVDPEVTIGRYLMIFYWCINIGAFFQLATTYAEHDVGFWLAYLLPGIIYMLMPLVLFLVYKRIVKAPPTGSVVRDAVRVFRASFDNGGYKRALEGGDAYWQQAKPSYMAATGTIEKRKEGWVCWDDEFVDELKTSLSACKVFLFLPIFALADAGFGSVQTNQAASMVSNGVPNDLIGNFNALTICICAPILNFGLYPMLRSRGINLGCITRLCIGYVIVAIAMVVGAILQWKVYETSPCGYHATDCKELSTVSLWAQIPLYSLPAIAELFVYTTSYEMAYTLAPARMKGLIYAFVLFSSALSSALVEILNPVLRDPYLIWPFVAAAAANVLCAICLQIWFRDLNTPPPNWNSVERMGLAKAEVEEEKR